MPPLKNKTGTLKNGKCTFKQNGDIIEELAREYQSKLEENDFSLKRNFRKEKFLKDIKNELRRIGNGKKEESGDFQERLHDVLRTKMYDKQPNYNHLEFKDEAGEKSALIDY